MSVYTGQPQNVAIISGSSDVSSSNPLPVSSIGALSTTFSNGQKAVTNSAATLGSTTAFKNGLALTCLSSSTASIFIGTSGVTTSNGYELAPGQSIVVPIQDIASIYVVAVASSTSTIAWIGFN